MHIATLFQRRRSRFYIFLSLVITIATIGLSGGLSQVLTVKEVNFNALLQDPPPSQAPILLAFTADFISVDATEGTMVIDWYIFSTNCTQPAPVNIFVDRNLLSSNGDLAVQSTSDDSPTQPFFRFNTSRGLNCPSDPSTTPTSFPFFRIVTKVISRAHIKGLGSGLQSYPWDKYFALISMYAQLADTNQSVGIAYANSHGAPVNFKVRLGEFYNTVGGGLQLQLLISRSRAVRILVVFVGLANWLVTIAFLWITIAGVIWPEEVVKEMFALPIAALFGFTAVRANMPGAPTGFGSTMDSLTILPNIALMTVCTAVLLGVILLRRASMIERLNRQEISRSNGGDVYMRTQILLPASQQQCEEPDIEGMVSSTALRYSAAAAGVGGGRGMAVPTLPPGMASPMTNEMSPGTLSTAPWSPYADFTPTMMDPVATGGASRRTGNIFHRFGPSEGFLTGSRDGAVPRRRA